MKAVEIVDVLARAHFRRFHQVIVPNVVSMAGILGEADLLILQPSNWLEEVEIKTTKADFKREFAAKVGKHKMLVGGIPRLELAIDAAKNGRFVRDFNDPKPHTIRRFWFAMPYDLAQEVRADIPKHAGLIGVFENRFVSPVTIIKAPALAMARKVSDKERARLFELAYARYWDIRLTGKVGR